MDASPKISLESADAAADLREAFDASTGRWAFPQTGDFWDAVRAAHARGQRGAGVRIAIVDTACDLSIPLLARATGGRAVTAPAQPASRTSMARRWRCWSPPWRRKPNSTSTRSPRMASRAWRASPPPWRRSAPRAPTSSA